MILMKRGLLIRTAGNDSWIGGVYYTKNIIFQLLQSDKIRQEYNIILLAEKRYMEIFQCFDQNIVIIRKDPKLHFINKIYLAYALIRYNVRYVFPFNKKIPFLKCSNIAWIPDFQYITLPYMYQEQVIKEKDIECKKIASNEAPLVLSSQDALNTYRMAFGYEKKNIYIVPFVSFIEGEVKQISRSEEIKIMSKYNLENERYICIINQFWKHKNHIFVLNAIEKYLESNDSSVRFVFTGKLFDDRNPDYIYKIRKYFEETKYKRNIIYVGFIERLDQIVLMKNSEFIIQPSLCEGWGTVVEDAKVLDKTVLLSDIPVHREQKNEKSILFDPYDVNAFVNLLKDELGKSHVSSLEVGIKNMYCAAQGYIKGFESLICR